MGDTVNNYYGKLYAWRIQRSKDFLRLHHPRLYKKLTTLGKLYYPGPKENVKRANFKTMLLLNLMRLHFQSEYNDFVRESYRAYGKTPKRGRSISDLAMDVAADWVAELRN